MNNLVSIKKNDVFTDSLVISRGTGIRHDKLKESIRKYESQIKKFGKLSTSHGGESTGGRRAEVYALNEQQATFLITLLKNTEVVVAFKMELVNEFFQMRQMLFQKQTLDWQETRRTGKLTRREETDVISELAEYAKEQGSKNSQRLYMVYSKLANKVAGVSDREIATITQINNLSLIEHIILHVIRTGMQQSKHYKEIYRDSKLRLEQFSDIACLNRHELPPTGTCQ
jgi:phage regulator Rha-like protein